MTFLDTNVLVYSIDGKDPAKQVVAREIVVSAVRGGGFLISAQVLNEFSNIALLKLKLSVEEVRKFVSFFSRIGVVSLESRWTDAALLLKQRYETQFFDSLLLVAAQENGCDEILTEDLNDGQMYGSVKAVNPFKNF
jgi:predicted nucleic acid-binding protein